MLVGSWIVQLALSVASGIGQRTADVWVPLGRRVKFVYLSVYTDNTVCVKIMRVGLLGNLQLRGTCLLALANPYERNSRSFAFTSLEHLTRRHVLSVA
ncbi:hypothetical protein PYCCODRAFT_861274 [Trametes coccinea BRFM310]|uniref:Secreted protein n=1 Tax=Trametes coccinea (strain BRFM310) TaxID=1353009 RepID=A0A1Y2IEP8_TRAC3|nr:hypothetical protein PYCCODRAFT_861274 [Trametes coccinea BRFM310]